MGKPEDEANKAAERIIQKQSQKLNDSTDPWIKPFLNRNIPGQFSYVSQQSYHPLPPIFFFPKAGVGWMFVLLLATKIFPTSTLCLLCPTPSPHF